MSKRLNAPLAIIAGLLLFSGGAWTGVSANRSTHASQPQAVTAASAPAITHDVAGTRVSYADVVKVVAPSVVTIRTEGKAKVSPTEFEGPDDFFQQFFGQSPFGRRGQPSPRTFRQRALGSGVIVSSDGYILTNDHVVDGADEIRIDLNDDRTLTAKVVGTDKASDLALLKVDAKDLRAISMGNSDGVQVGDVVLAVGNPLGIGQTVTMGIISAKGRSTGVGDGGYEDFLQTDAPINHGNSGGALVDSNGALVGINSQILSSNDGNIGIGFAIPVNMARHVMDQLKTTGHVERSQLGVTVQAVTSDMAASLGLKHAGGAIVSSVTSGSAADAAGIKRGDVIETFNGQPVHDTNALRNHVAETQPGSTVSVGIVREGAEKTMSVKLQEAQASARAAEESDSGDTDKAALGVAVEPVTPDVAAQLGAPKDIKGVVVAQVNPDGRAADAGIQRGDIIQEVNRQPVTSIDALRSAVRKTSDRPLLILLNRKGNNLFVTVRPVNG